MCAVLSQRFTEICFEKQRAQICCRIWTVLACIIWTSLCVFTALCTGSDTTSLPPGTVTSSQAMATICSSFQIHSCTEAIDLELLCEHKASRALHFHLPQAVGRGESQPTQAFYQGHQKQCFLLDLFCEGRVFPAG